MTRWKAAGIHFLASALVGIAVGALLFGVWYPPPYFHAAGADNLILLLVGVDLCLGPLLTLIVFRLGKWGLKFDLVCIALAQIAALLYGLSIVLESRPVFLAGVLDRFVLVSANEISDSDLAQGREPQFRSRSWTGPRLVAAELPTNPIERSDLAFSALAGRDVQNLPKYYRDYAGAATQLLKKAKSLARLREMHPESATIISRWLQRSGRTADSVVWLPLVARKTDLVMLLDAQTAQILQPLAIDPW